MMITKGRTWYMKYGFKPYNSISDKPDKKLKRVIKLNNKILRTLETKQLNLFNLLEKAINKGRININLKEIKSLINTHKLFSHFMRRLENDFVKYCDVVNYILDIVYDRKRKKRAILRDFHGESFYLDI